MRNVKLKHKEFIRLGKRTTICFIITEEDNLEIVGRSAFIPSRRHSKKEVEQIAFNAAMRNLRTVRHRINLTNKK